MAAEFSEVRGAVRDHDKWDRKLALHDKGCEQCKAAHDDPTDQIGRCDTGDAMLDAKHWARRFVQAVIQEPSL